MKMREKFKEMDNSEVMGPAKMETPDLDAIEEANKIFLAVFDVDSDAEPDNSADPSFKGIPAKESVVASTPASSEISFGAASATN